MMGVFQFWLFVKKGENLWFINPTLSFIMTEPEFLPLALSKYESIKSLSSATFYEHEKDFEDIVKSFTDSY
jgi:hypothetical protein